MTRTLAPFPAARLRRLRKSPALRSMVRETSLAPSDFIWPVFLMAGKDEETAIPSMPGVTRKTINTVERGHYVPSTVLALRLADALDTTVEALFELSR